MARKTAHLKQFQFKKGGGKVGKASTKRATVKKSGKKPKPWKTAGGM